MRADRCGHGCQPGWQRETSKVQSAPPCQPAACPRVPSHQGSAPMASLMGSQTHNQLSNSSIPLCSSTPLPLPVALPKLSAGQAVAKASKGGSRTSLSAKCISQHCTSNILLCLQPSCNQLLPHFLFLWPFTRTGVQKMGQVLLIGIKEMLLADKRCKHTTCMTSAHSASPEGPQGRSILPVGHPGPLPPAVHSLSCRSDPCAPPCEPS